MWECGTCQGVSTVTKAGATVPEPVPFGISLGLGLFFRELVSNLGIFFFCFRL